MRTENTPETFGFEPRMPSRAELDRILRDARRMRAETQAELLRSAGRGILCLSRALSRPLTLAINGLGSTARTKRTSPAEPALQ